MTSFLKLDREVRLIDVVSILGLIAAGILWIGALQAQVDNNAEELSQNQAFTDQSLQQIRDSLRRIEGKLDQHLISHSSE
jgi:hypothetical protein